MNHMGGSGLHWITWAVVRLAPALWLSVPLAPSPLCSGDQESTTSTGLPGTGDLEGTPGGDHDSLENDRPRRTGDGRRHSRRYQASCVGTPLSSSTHQ